MRKIIIFCDEGDVSFIKKLLFPYEKIYNIESEPATYEEQQKYSDDMGE